MASVSEIATARPVGYRFALTRLSQRRRKSAIAQKKRESKVENLKTRVAKTNYLSAHAALRIGCVCADDSRCPRLSTRICCGVVKTLYPRALI